jgi:hypothetical protein
MAPPETPPDHSAPRVLLFGHRGAGKSALIGALLQAGETQGETLRGQVVHSSVDLPRIRDAVYEGRKIEPSQRELVSYHIRLRPWRDDSKAPGEPMSVVLDDCDGKAAEALLEHPEPVAQQAFDSPVARSIAEADALMLLVDAASTDEELNEAFREFDRFLKAVGRAKAEAREVGGFPVFLVLTQCDRLARAGDTAASWEARVKQRADAAWKAFDDFLKEAAPEGGEASPYLSFGSIDLTVMPAAVRRPPVAHGGLPPNQPYGVAELFRDCFAEAKAHNDRVHASNKRLKWTVRFALAGFALLTGTLAAIALFPPQEGGGSLAERVRNYEAHEPPPAVRLADADIERYRGALSGFATDPAFPHLEPDLRQFVESRLKEIDDYRAYRARLADATAPASARGLPDLEKICDALKTTLAPPPDYAWEETPAAQLRAKWLADCAAIRAAEKGLTDWYRDLDKDATAQMLTRNFDAEWLRGVEAIVAKGTAPPEPLGKPLPGSPTLDRARGEAVTYAVPYEFDEVYQARRYWEQARDRLLDLRALADALGLTSGPDRPPAVLVLPEPGPGVDSASLPAARWAALQKNYPPPPPPDGYGLWELWHFPDPARTELAKRLKSSFDAGAHHVQKLLNPTDTKAGWKEAAAKLAEPPFREWGRLLHLLARLQVPTAPDPVAELATFLGNLDKPFALDLQGFQLTIPLDLTVGLERVGPSGPLTITVSNGQQVRGSAKFAVGKGDTRGQATLYPLSREGAGKLQYFAGDELRAELPVKAGTQELKLVWDQGPSKTFQFDRLSREPRLVRPTGTGGAAPGVRLTPSPGSTIPQFPALMPVK